MAGIGSDNCYMVPTYRSNGKMIPDELEKAI